MRRFQTNCYDDRWGVGKAGKEIIETDKSVAERMNEYKLIWTPEKVTWFFNGKQVRKIKDVEYVPQNPLQPRLHTRSAACERMGDGESFAAIFESFEYIPYAMLLEDSAFADELEDLDEETTTEVVNDVGKMTMIIIGCLLALVVTVGVGFCLCRQKKVKIATENTRLWRVTDPLRQ